MNSLVEAWISAQKISSGSIENGSSSCTASSSIPNKNKAESAVDGMTANWFHELAKETQNASGNNNTQVVKNREVCRVYTSGTGAEKILSQTSHASRRAMMFLSSSVLSFASTVKFLTQAESSRSATIGRCLAESSLAAASWPSAACKSAARSWSSDGPRKNAAKQRENAQVHDASPSISSLRASPSAIDHVEACRSKLREALTMRPHVILASSHLL
mmetsp:Transcript_125358/g.401466  ORF Transcript_125358/g.401466 Transcript_125358/m.401466 type:complete len:217 (+) Transcript_125358:89-739(+)